MIRICLVFSLLCCAHVVSADDEAPPNIVFILADDLGVMDVGFNHPECFYDTPNLDRLAASGVRCTNAYAACPVCSPTRASILTGRAPTRVGITDYINPGRGNQPERWNRNTKLLPAPFRIELPHEEVTLAEICRDNGYATFFAGKWHLGGDGFLPTDQGFDINMGGLARGGPYGGDKYFSPYGNAHLPDGPKGEHLPERLGRETADFIKANRARPFLAYLSFYSVHTPLIGRPDLVEEYRERQGALAVRDGERRQEGARRTRIVQDHAVYAAMVEAMDHAIGVVLDALEEHGLDDNTIVVFFSDNGGLSTSEGHPTSNEPFRAGKGWMYEGGIREPCIVRAPGVTTAGAICDAPFISTDWLPTLLDLAGLDAPDVVQLDGRSVATALAGDALDVAPLCWHYPHYGNQGGSPCGAVRLGPWKLIEWYEDGRIELFHLHLDPSETTDVSALHPEVCTKLRDMLRQWRIDTGAIMPTQNTRHDE